MRHPHLSTAARCGRGLARDDAPHRPQATTARSQGGSTGAMCGRHTAWLRHLSPKPLCSSAAGNGILATPSTEVVVGPTGGPAGDATQLVGPDVPSRHAVSDRRWRPLLAVRTPVPAGPIRRPRGLEPRRHRDPAPDGTGTCSSENRPQTRLRTGSVPSQPAAASCTVVTSQRVASVSSMTSTTVLVTPPGS